MRYDKRANSYRDPVPTDSRRITDKFDTDVNDSGNVGNRHVDQLARRDRFDVRAFAPQRRARLPISSENIEPDNFDDRLPLFLDQAIEDEVQRRRSFFPGLVVRTGALIAVAAAIAGLLVFKQDLFKELSPLTSEMMNKIAGITTQVFRPTSSIAGAFAAIDGAAEDPASNLDASARAMDRLKRHASTLALAGDDLSLPKKEAGNGTVSLGKTDTQERAMDVRNSPRVVDQTELATLVAPLVAAASPRRLDVEELIALMKRAKSLIAVGDIASARLLLERAAEAKEATAALLLAETYDPAVVGAQDMRSISPDPVMARSWYEKAARFGSAEAQQRLAQMQN